MMRKVDAWLGVGVQRTSNTKPMSKAKARRVAARSIARKSGKRMGKDAKANSATGTKSWA